MTTFDDVRGGEEEIKYYPATDFSLPKNRVEKQRLLSKVVLQVVQRRIGELYQGIYNDNDDKDEEAHKDYEGMRADLTLALNDPLAFVRKVSARSLDHFDAGAMVRSDIFTEAEAKQLIDLALSNLKMNRKNL